jgi:hypothetical protein
MGLITPNDFQSLRELYTAQLRYLLSTEEQIVKGLPDMIGTLTVCSSSKHFGLIFRNQKFTFHDSKTSSGM